MSARHAVLTGGSRGIGLAAAEQLAGRGWQLTLLARDAAALEGACDALPGDGHAFVAMDVADEDAWRRISERLTSVQGLVCAAALLDPIGPIGSYSAADFRRTLDVNVVGVLLAIEACLPGLRSQGGSVVTFSGGGGTAPLRRFDAYAASKAAVVRLTENVALELADANIRVNSIAPGFVATDIHRSTLAAGPELVGTDYFERTRTELERGGVPAGEAAELVCVLLDQDPEPWVSGKLVSAQWDPWRDPAFWRRLAGEPDLGTLRRIDDQMFAARSEPLAQ